MAIARSASAYYNAVQTWGNLGTSASLAIDCTGTNTVLVVWVQTTTGPGELITGVTYNGIAMTQGIKQLLSGNTTYYSYLYYLVNPSSGSNNVVASFSSAESSGQLIARCYTDAGTPDVFASNTAGSGSPASVNITTLVDNAWVVGGIGVFSGNKITASSGTVMSRGDNVSFCDTADSNGAKSPAGAYTLSGTHGGGNWTVVAMSIPPYSASGPANLKSYNTNVKANIKSIDTNLIANVKSLDTNV